MDKRELRTRRKALHLTVTDCGYLARYSPFVIQKMELGRRPIYPKDAARLSAVLSTLEQARVMAANEVAVLLAEEGAA